MLDSDEMSLLEKALEMEEGVKSHCYALSDGAGRAVRMSCWNQPGNDVTGILARTEKVAGTFEKVPEYSAPPGGDFFLVQKQKGSSSCHTSFSVVCVQGEP